MGPIKMVSACTCALRLSCCIGIKCRANNNNIIQNFRVYSRGVGSYLRGGGGKCLSIKSAHRIHRNIRKNK